MNKYFVTYFFILVCLGVPCSHAQSYAYRISSNQITLHGTSNIKSFSCNYKDKLPNETISFSPTGNDHTTITLAPISLHIAKLDCGNSAMNSEMREALKYNEFPHIFIRLRRATGAFCKSCSEPSQLNLLADVTIAGVRKPLQLEAKLLTVSDNTLLFTTSKTLNMSDFNITPPTGLGGLIRVHDRITLKFAIKGRI